MNTYVMSCCIMSCYMTIGSKRMSKNVYTFQWAGLSIIAVSLRSSLARCVSSTIRSSETDGIALYRSTKIVRDVRWATGSGTSIKLFFSKLRYVKLTSSLLLGGRSCKLFSLAFNHWRFLSFPKLEGSDWIWLDLMDNFSSECNSHRDSGRWVRQQLLIQSCVSDDNKPISPGKHVSVFELALRYLRRPNSQRELGNSDNLLWSRVISSRF